MQLLLPTGRGIGSFESNPSGAGASLMDCLKEAETLIPSDKHSNTPVYLGATADMRLLQSVLFFCSLFELDLC